MKRLISNLNELTIIYAQEELPKKITKSIFLAGPTSRDNGITEWRLKAIDFLKTIGYDGVVFIPELRNGIFNNKYEQQVEWETKMLNLCDTIVFWIDRKYSEGLTTNVEWGKYQNSGKVVMGFNDDEKGSKYIKYECDKLKVPVFNTLEDTLVSAVENIGDGALRINGECYVPLNIWNTDMFQNWYNSQKSVGNVLEEAKVNYIFKMPKAQKIFLWILHVKVFIKDENRYKENEFVVARTDISSVVIYRKDDEDILNSDIILIEEFRSPARNDICKVYEVPGGSSIKDNVDPFEIIIEEIEEETGLTFDKERIDFIMDRQMVSTLSSHKSFLYSVKISDEEFDEIKKQEGNVNGVESDTERTYLRILKLKDILNSNLLDWSNIGYIFSALFK